MNSLVCKQPNHNKQKYDSSKALSTEYKEYTHVLTTRGQVTDTDDRR